METKYVFNLLKPVEQPKTTWDEVYEWILKQARLFIIFSIITIFSIFVSKIFLDTVQKNKLQEINLIKKELSFLEVEEAGILNIQNKVKAYELIWEKSSNYGSVLNQLNELSDKFNDEISIQINKNTLSLNGSETLNNLQKFESELKGSDIFSDVLTRNLSQDEKDLEKSVGNFSFLGLIKPEFLFRSFVEKE